MYSRKHPLTKKKRVRDEAETNLSVFFAKDRIIDSVRDNRVTVITAETGSGKSTLIPQYLSSGLLCNSKPPVIACTTPTRLCAIQLARFVSKQLKTTLGLKVGYSIGGDKRYSQSTFIHYITAGVLREKVLSKDKLSYDIICVDEVHTRTVDIDCILYFLREELKTNHELRIVLMSASINTEKFVRYFLNDNEINLGKYRGESSIKRYGIVPVFMIKGKPFQNQIFFIGDVIDKLNRVNGCGINKGMILGSFRKENSLRMSLDRQMKIALDLLLDIHLTKELDSHIIVFLPGIAEIVRFVKELDRYFKSKGCESYLTKILHSSLSRSDQEEVVQGNEINNQKRKIIVATDIVESSITVPNIDFIIDFCFQKENSNNGFYGLSQLKLRWTNKQSLLQRAGRTGRTRPGTVFRMISKKFFNMLDECITPEIVRVPVDRIILKLLGQKKNSKKNKKKSVETVLSKFISPPSPEKIHLGLMNLKAKGTIDHARNVTSFGEFVLSLPFRIEGSEMIHLSSVIDKKLIFPAVVMAAIAETRSLFYFKMYSPIQSMLSILEKNKEFRNDLKLKFGVKGVDSDHIFSFMLLSRYWEDEHKRSTDRKWKYKNVKRWINNRNYKEVENKIAMALQRLDKKNGGLLMKNFIKNGEPFHNYSLLIEEKVVKTIPLMLNVSYRNFICTIFNKMERIPRVTKLDPSRTVILDTSDFCMRPRKLKQFLMKFDHGCISGNFFIKQYDSFPGKLFIEMSNKVEQSTYVLTKLNFHEFEKMPGTSQFEEKNKDFLPYYSAHTSGQPCFESIFFTPRVRFPMRTVLKKWNRTSITFSSCSLVSKGDFINISQISQVPSFEVLFLLFEKNIRESLFGKGNPSRIGKKFHQQGMLDVKYNGNIFSFKPNLNYSIVHKINNLRKKIESGNKFDGYDILELSRLYKNFVPETDATHSELFGSIDFVRLERKRIYRMVDTTLLTIAQFTPDLFFSSSQGEKVKNLMGDFFFNYYQLKRSYFFYMAKECIQGSMGSAAIQFLEDVKGGIKCCKVKWKKLNNSTNSSESIGGPELKQRLQIQHISESCVQKIFCATKQAEMVLGGKMHYIFDPKRDKYGGMFFVPTGNVSDESYEFVGSEVDDKYERMYNNRGKQFGSYEDRHKFQEGDYTVEKKVQGFPILISQLYPGFSLKTS